MANPFRRFFNRTLSSFGYVPKENQIIISNDTDISETNKLEDKDSGIIKASSSKLYEVFKKLVQPRNYDLEYPDSKLKTIQNALKVESYLRRARDRYTELIWKNGYDFIGKNKKAVNYVKKRFKEIAFVTEKPTTVLFEELTQQLIPFYNCFIYKVRTKKSSSGTDRKYFGKTVLPVAGYFVLDPTRVAIKVDPKDENRILGYNYFDYNHKAIEIEDIDYRDVIHICIDREPGKFYGDPPAAAVLDDIRALRRMEENVEILVFQHAIPIYHYKVGSNEKPCKPGEVDTVRQEVENMLTQGMIVTPERHEIKAVGAQREALQVDKYLEYFKTRILTGLGHSTTSLGEGGAVSRATASVLEKGVLDASKRFQLILKTYLDNFLINELLQEGGFDIFDDDNRVELFLPEIDLDSQIRKEYHNLQMYQGNVITEDEARKNIGRDPFSDKDRKNTYFELVLKPRALMLAGDEPWMQMMGMISAPPTSGGSGGGKVAGGGTQAAGANREAPKNQFGTKTVGNTSRTKGADSVEVTDAISPTVKEIIDSYKQRFYGEYKGLTDEVMDLSREHSLNSLKISINMSKRLIVDDVAKFIIDSYKLGITEVGFNVLTPIDADLKLLHSLHTNSISRFYDDILNRIDLSDRTMQSVIDVLDSQKYRIDFIADWFIKKSYWLAVSSSLSAKGENTVKVIRKNEDKNDKCYTYPEIIDLKKFDLTVLPPHHPGCACFLEF